MARKKNSAFAGVTVREADVGTATYERSIANVVGDVALSFDKITGSHSEAGLIVHDGGDGTGAPLHMPIVNQYVGRSIALTSAAAKGSDGGTGSTRVLSYPLHLCPGETQLYVEVAATSFATTVDKMNPTVQIVDTTNTEEATANLEVVDHPGETGALMTARITGLTAGDHIVFVRFDTSDADIQADAFLALHYARIRPHGDLGPYVGAIKESHVPSACKPPGPTTGQTFGVTTPASSEGLPHRNFDAGLFADLEPIDAYVTAGLNRNLSNALEYVTAWPAGGNAAYTQRDDTATDPATSRFEAHTLSAYATEGEIDFPVWCESFGAFMESGKFSVELVEPPTKGMLSWYAPWPTANTSTEIASAHITLPDFQTSSSKLKAMVLLGSSTGATLSTAWTVTITTDAGSASAAPVVVDSGTKHLWLATVTAIPFNPDTENKIDISTSKSSAKSGVGEICVLGVHLYFDA